jgi:hypothetical protein
MLAGLLANLPAAEHIFPAYAGHFKQPVRKKKPALDLSRLGRGPIFLEPDGRIAPDQMAKIAAFSDDEEAMLTILWGLEWPNH